MAFFSRLKLTLIENALNQLGALGVTDAEIVTDNGYYSEPNLSEMLQKGFDFVTLAKTSLKWIRPEIDMSFRYRDDCNHFIMVVK